MPELRSLWRLQFMRCVRIGWVWRDVWSPGIRLFFVQRGVHCHVGARGRVQCFADDLREDEQAGDQSRTSDEREPAADP